MIDINVCFASNDGYAPYMGTAIASLLSNAEDDENINIYIISENINDLNKQKLLSLKKIRDCNINFIEPKEEIFKYISKYNMKANSTWFRLSIPSLIPNAEKIVYLDGDMIINSSLRELFSDDMEDYYAYVVEDIIDKIDEVKGPIGFSKTDKYFNAGFLMINNKLWIRDNLEEKFYNAVDSMPILGYKDQDILNYCLKNRVKFIDKKWDFIDDKSYHSNIYKYSMDNINILHCVAKPWKITACKSYFADEFWKYYQLTPWFLERPIDAIQTILAQKYGDYEKTKLKINDVKCFGVYHNRNTLEIVIFFIKIRIEMSFKNVNKIAWFIPVKKWRESFKRAFDV
uniref:glycosyltransferase family 8 protein n=1 Tax=Brachyspira catarrhinii TaxID=2528966 RepID=UPI003F4B2B53